MNTAPKPEPDGIDQDQGKFEDVKKSMRMALLCLTVETVYLVFSTRVFLLHRPSLFFPFRSVVLSEILYFSVILLLYATVFLILGAIIGLISRKIKFEIRRRASLISIFFFIWAGIKINWDVLPPGVTVFSLKGVIYTGAVLAISITMYYTISRLTRYFNVEMRTRTIFLVFVTLLACWGILSVDADQTSSSKPDIYLVVMDTMRADALGAYGRDPSPTPYIDGFAAKAEVFENAYTVAPWTLPSHVSIFTSRYTLEHGALAGTFDRSRTPDRITIQEELLDRGYRTYALVGNPVVALDPHTRSGFEGFWVLSDLRDNYVLFRLLDYFVDRWDDDDKGASFSNRIFRRLLRYKRGPRFVFINWMEMHSPYYPPEEVQKRWLGRHITRKEYLRVSRKVHSDSENILRADTDTRRFLWNCYLANANYLDNKFRELVEILNDDSEQRARESLVIITSDHGENILEHNLWGHISSLHNTVTKVPLIFRYPGAQNIGRRTDNASSLDIYPTILDILGYEITPDVRGVSLRNVPARPREIFLEFYHPAQFMLASGKTARASRSRHYLFFPKNQRSIISTDGWKLIEGSDPVKKELYDLSSDMMERNNLVTEHPARERKMEKRLEGFFHHLPEHKNFKILFTDGDRDSLLRGLGYF